MLLPSILLGPFCSVRACHLDAPLFKVNCVARRGLAVTSRIVQIDTKGRVDAAFVVQLLGRISFCFRIS
jgi:hypothetical protein